MRVKSEVKHEIKAFAVPLTFEKRIVKYENDTISKEESKNAMNSVISALQTLVSRLLVIQRLLTIGVTMRNLWKKGPSLKI